MPLKSIYLGGSIPNVITDIILIAMPMPYVWRLHAPVAQRIVLCGMFVLGIFIAIVSIVRLTIFMKIPIATAADVTFNFREVIVWSTVEINVGLVCACLPSLRPFVAILGLNKIFSFTNSRPSNAKSPGPSGYAGYGDRSNDRSHGRKKGSTGGLFSTIGGMTKLDDASEEYQLTDAPSAPGKNNVDVETTRVSHDTDSERGSKNRAQGGLHGIQVQRDWSVLVNEKDNRGRAH
jgi:hypothetical protein